MALTLLLFLEASKLIKILPSLVTNICEKYKAKIYYSSHVNVSSIRRKFRIRNSEEITFVFHKKKMTDVLAAKSKYLP